LEGVEVRFVVRTGDLGRGVLARENFEMLELPGQGLPRTLSPRLLTFPFKLAAGLGKAFQLLRKLRPQAVLGMGGYLSFPVLAAARLLGIPTMIHEQNVIPGLTNRLLGRLVSSVALSFPEGKAHFSTPNSWIAGLPVREEMVSHVTAESRSGLGLDPTLRTLFVFGGSQGAQRLNEIVLETWRLLLEQGVKFQVLHVTGEKTFAAIKARYDELPVKAQVLSYCHSMAEAYAAADLVICRSGASTIAELIAVNRLAILVPFPHASDNHQFFNAKVLETAGAARIIEEKALTRESLAAAIRDMSDPAGTKPAPELRRLIDGAAGRIAHRIVDTITGLDGQN
jgi:UDP-N-acetylglucosamine--N-acetylmuramyl-(pentapeptide) pyrophosphoryl-undecaprenol N-acetylglucosamine transferase